jgi:predicted dehydrogenase
VTLRVGILGAAGIAPKALIDPVRRRNGDVVVEAVASRRAAAASSYAEEHGIPRSFGGYEAMLADPEIDLVYNALPPSGHAEWTIAALEAGKAVLCEKPFAMDRSQAQAMVDAAERTGRLLVEAFHHRYHPLWEHAAAYRDSDRIGRVQHLVARFDAAIPFAPDSLRHDPELGGGALMDLGCYALHWARTFAGEEPTVEAAEADLNDLGADQSIRARLAFPSGLTAVVEASMDGPFRQELILEGTEGRVAIDGLVFPSRGHSVREETDGVARYSTVAGLETYDHQLDAVVRALGSGEALPTGGADSVANMTAIDAIYDAAGVDRRPR